MALSTRSEVLSITSSSFIHENFIIEIPHLVSPMYQQRWGTHSWARLSQIFAVEDIFDEWLTCIVSLQQCTLSSMQKRQNFSSTLRTAYIHLGVGQVSGCLTMNHFYFNGLTREITYLSQCGLHSEKMWSSKSQPEEMKLPRDLIRYV